MSIRKLTGMLFLVNGMQFMTGAAVLLGLCSRILEYSEGLLYLSVCFVLLSGLLSMAGLFSVIRYQNNSFRESMENLENLNTKLREQRHDYLNQIQVVFGLLELGEYEDARDYLRPVFKDIVRVNQALKTAKPAVNALLQAKMEAAAQQGIDFYPEISTSLQELAMEPWELCKVLANLIDNAVTAVSHNEGEKRVVVRLEERKTEYCIRVENNGPEIPESQQKLIFSRGYTTKKGDDHGMGLAIVTDVLKEAGGSIMVESCPEQTVFQFQVPRGKTEKIRAKSDRLGRKMYK